MRGRGGGKGTGKKAGKEGDKGGDGVISEDIPDGREVLRRWIDWMEGEGEADVRYPSLEEAVREARG